MADIKRVHDDLVDNGFCVGIKSRPGRVKDLRITKVVNGKEYAYRVFVETDDNLRFDNTDNIINEIKRSFNRVIK